MGKGAQGRKTQARPHCRGAFAHPARRAPLLRSPASLGGRLIASLARASLKKLANAAQQIFLATSRIAMKAPISTTVRISHSVGVFIAGPRGRLRIIAIG